MKTNIFIPKRINVGFQTRSDTYTKQLAYIIYFDEKGVLRKEKSWEGWRDKKIEPQQFDNIPTSGFVLNKKVGDYVSDWSHRQAYVRVYDSRNFEFEITIENLLYILENTSSIKGKGLEGEFIYAFSGKDLVLIPTESPDYKEMEAYNTIVHEKNFIKAKDLIIGATYKAKDNVEWVYMGRFDYYSDVSERVPYETKSYYGTRTSYNWVTKNVNKGKHHYFARMGKYSSYSDEISLFLLELKSLSQKFIGVVSTDCAENYSELFEKMECTTSYSPLDKNKDEYIPYTFNDLEHKFKDTTWFYCYGEDKNEYELKRVYGTENIYTYCDRNSYKNQGEYSLQDLYNKIKPMYKNEYLTNYKFYRRQY